MAIKAYPLNNTLYSADDAQLMQLPVTSGVYGQKGNFDITLNNNMKATISSGLAFFRIDTAKGFTVYMDAASTVTISAASTANPRIDRIVLRWKSSTNSVTLTVIKGTAAASPTAPALSRTATQFDICLYDILVDKSVTKIEDYAVTDQRLNDSVCGLLANHAYKVDTSNLQARINELIASQATEIQDITDDKVADAVAARTFFPTKGTDYWTQEDQELMVNGVLNNYTSISDTTPYVFRKTNNGTAVGKYETLKTIVGASVVWNQLVQDGTFTSTTKWSPSNGTRDVSNGELTVTINSGNNYALAYQGLTATSGHKVLMMCDAKVSTATRAQLQFYANSSSMVETTSTSYERLGIIGIAGDEYTRIRLRLTGTGGDTAIFRNAVAYDLTAMFPAAIADRAYTLEQTTAGSGIAWLQSYGFFTKPYYAYTGAPSLQSVKTSAHETIGFNQWDEEWELGGINNGGNNTVNTDRIRSKNYIPVLPNTTYYFKAPQNIAIRWYDSNKQVISTGTLYGDTTSVSPANAAYLRFYIGNSTYPVTTYGNNICINLHGDRDGEYEPYHKNTYAFDSTKTLNGILKLDENYNIYADGDVYHNDGTIDRNYEERAYQSGDEELANAITDGTYTVVKLAIPTTETAEQFVGTQECSPSGTERYIDAKYEAGERDFELPVGHETKYAEPIAS